ELGTDLAVEIGVVESDDEDLDGADGHGGNLQQRRSRHAVWTPPVVGSSCSASGLHRPAVARELIRARCKNALCATSTFAGTPPHAASAEAWRARPYEYESGHGPPTRLIAPRFPVACSSVWPPERNTTPGTSAGT